jgi:hypothetical protein
LAAADFSGRWAEEAVNVDGTAVPIYPTLGRQGEAISGNLIKVEPKAIPVTDAVVRNDEPRFRISENDGQSTEYALTMGVTGH